MPILRVFDERGELTPNAGDLIWATMLAPEGPESNDWQLHLAAGNASKALDAGADCIVVDRAAFDRLYTAGRNAVETDGRRRQRDGEQIGEILLAVFSLSQEQPAVASLGKAMRLHATSMGQHGEEVRLLRATSKLRAAWNELEPAAPMWAGYRLLLRAEEYGEGAAIDWPMLLALADILRVWGENHHSPVGRSGSKPSVKQLWPAEKCWRPPEHAVLPRLEARKRMGRLRLGWDAARMIRETPAPTPA